MIAASLLVMLAGTSAWTARPFEGLVIEPQAYVCTTGQRGGSFYVIVQHDPRRHLLRVAKTHRDTSEIVELGNALTSMETRGDSQAGGWRLLAGNAESGPRVAIALTQEWQAGKTSSALDLMWEGRRYDTTCSAVDVPPALD
jgi:hypothetical protein